MSVVSIIHMFVILVLRYGIHRSYNTEGLYYPSARPESQTPLLRSQPVSTSCSTNPLPSSVRAGEGHTARG